LITDDRHAKTQSAEESLWHSSFTPVKFLTASSKRIHRSKKQSCSLHCSLYFQPHPPSPLSDFRIVRQLTAPEITPTSMQHALLQASQENRFH
jgi:hypothetical protein